MGLRSLKFISAAALLLVSAGVAEVSAQEPRRPAPPAPAATPAPFPIPTNRFPRISRGGVPQPPFLPADTELRTAADPNVNVKFCVAEGSVKINGGESDEVRAFVKNGRKFSIKILERDAKTSRANWVWLAPENAENVTMGPSAQCLSGDSIEIDLPVGASVDIEGRSTDVHIDSIKKIRAKIVEGNIALNNISGGINATAMQGDLLVEASAGAISLESTTGNIVANDVSPGQIGDLFRAKTSSGAITLQQVSHRQIEANSITGSVIFDGGFLTGGIYNLKTSNGSIILLIPDKASCKITATYGFGSFNTDLPLKFIYQNENTQAKNLAATLGNGEACNLTLNTVSGSISLGKQKE